MPVSTKNLRLLHPAENILAFYDGRIDGIRMASDAPNWLDDGAFALGFANYVLLNGTEALVYDTSISILHAQAIREELDRCGVTSIRVVLSHHHKDHVAGTTAFADCDIIASHKTAQALRDQEAAFAKATPPISPLIFPTTEITQDETLMLGDLKVQLRHLDIHSFDGLTLYLPATKTLLAGDTLEDTVTYVAEPDRLDVHLAELDRLATWDVAKILPNHGDERRIAAGGYGPDFITATQRYVEALLRCRSDATLAKTPLSELLKADIASGALTYYPPYEAVHASNLKEVLGN
ncbi:MAG: MBL fold metallo-hydrolase [Shimia sp.]|uniref:MBL fold metallo-hydrolase n=1 Tax=Shimia sp. TaxID=1954381 RepID=UPI004058E6E6